MLGPGGSATPTLSSADIDTRSRVRGLQRLVLSATERVWPGGARATGQGGRPNGAASRWDSTRSSDERPEPAAVFAAAGRCGGGEARFSGVRDPCHPGDRGRRSTATMFRLLRRSRQPPMSSSQASLPPIASGARPPSSATRRRLVRLRCRPRGGRVRGDGSREWMGDGGAIRGSGGAPHPPPLDPWRPLATPVGLLLRMSAFGAAGAHRRDLDCFGQFGAAARTMLAGAAGALSQGPGARQGASGIAIGHDVELGGS